MNCKCSFFLDEMLQELSINQSKTSEISNDITLATELPMLELSFAILMPHSQLPISMTVDSFVSTLPDLLEGHLVAVISPYPKINLSHGSYTQPRVGCTGKISDINYANGEVRMLIQGLCRFELVEELPSKKNTLPRITVSYSKFQNDLNTTANISNREQLLLAIGTYLNKFSIEQDWDTIKNTPSNVLISAITMAFPFHPLEKQSLLETISVEEQSQIITKIIEMDAYEKSLNPVTTVN